MSDTPQGPGWWQASDDRWYPPPQPELPGQGVTGRAPQADPYGQAGPAPGMPPGNSGMYGAPPQAPQKNRTGLFAGAGIVGAVVVVGALFLLLGDDDDDGDAELTSDTAEPADGTTDETLPPEAGSAPDEGAAEEPALPEGDGTGPAETGPGGSSGGGAPGETTSGSGTDEVTLENGLVVTEYGFASEPNGVDDAQFNVTYGAVIENTGDTPQEDLSLTVSAQADDGSAVLTETHEVSYVDAGDTFAVAFFDNGGVVGAIADLEFTFGGSSDGEPLGSGEVTSEVTTAVTDFGSIDVTVTAENTHDFDIDHPEGTAILRNTSGEILGGYSSFGTPSSLPAGSSGGGTFNIYMELEGLDLDPDATDVLISYPPG